MYTTNEKIFMEIRNNLIAEKKAINTEGLLFAHSLHPIFVGAFKSRFFLKTGFKKLEKLKELISDDSFTGEICCTRQNEATGAFGVFLKGDVSLMFSKDVSSFTNEEGLRLVEERNIKYCVKDYNDLEVTNTSMLNYCEIFVHPTKIEAIWMRSTGSKIKDLVMYEILKNKYPEMDIYMFKSSIYDQRSCNFHEFDLFENIIEKIEYEDWYEDESLNDKIAYLGFDAIEIGEAAGMDFDKSNLYELF